MNIFQNHKLATLLVVIGSISHVSSFNTPSSSVKSFSSKTAFTGLSNVRSSSTSQNMVLDPSIMDSASTLLTNLPAAASSVLPDFGSELLAFSDQGQNLAGIFFQASLLPYLIFLYFLGFKGNRTPALGNYGFQFLLLFVISTIPSGIISKGTFGVTLADCDWLHGSAELLLTVTNVLIVSNEFNVIMTKMPSNEY